ncbi:glycosyltransferase [Lactiplantibacillus plantarum]|uniref:glycosyltransferase n=1 Tax=Lactiplantibacillus plantarum TaxID=1590 RepID=UPI000824B06A|nr:glycosyltransferase [Lactiplantibacillus plantarum]QXI72063.1 glycosyltransferase [Lactiplantibacillus plantarum]
MMEQVNTLIVVVLYQQTPEESTSIQSFFDVPTVIRNQFRLLIVNNSAESQQISEYQCVTTYDFHVNQGLSKAYNLGLRYAKKHKCEWLMLFDQDSVFDGDYLQAFLNAQVKYQTNSQVGLLIPQVRQASRVLAPNPAVPAFNSDTLETGVYENITSINSGTMIRLSSIIRVGGFNEKFPLDFLDYWVFWRFRQEKFKTVVLDARLEHELSVTDLKTMANARYRSFVKAERLFFTEYETTEKHALWVHKALRVGKLIVTRNFRKAFINLRYW